MLEPEPDARRWTVAQASALSWADPPLLEVMTMLTPLRRLRRRLRQTVMIKELRHEPLQPAAAIASSLQTVQSARSSTKRSLRLCSEANMTRTHIYTYTNMVPR